MSLIDILFGKNTETQEIKPTPEEVEQATEEEKIIEDILAKEAEVPSYFTDKELMCKCGCGKVSMNEDFMKKLNKARDMAGKGWKVNSAYRCAAHNKAVGGVAGSSHTKGYAVDISATSSQKRFEIVSNAMKAGINRIGIGKTFVHLDTDPTKAGNVIFLY